MNPQGLEIIETLLQAYEQGSQLLLMFDYDGTLTPLVAHPRLAKLSPAMRKVLKRLASKPRIAMGILSGRALDDLKSMVGLEDLYYAGTVGMELDLKGQRLLHPRAEQMAELMVRIGELLKTVVYNYPGAWLEKKELGLTVHYRQVEASQRSELKNRTWEILKPEGGQLLLEDGPLAVEISPKHGWNKADALRSIISHLQASKIFPLYAGDAANDISVLKAVGIYNGIGVWIGNQSPSVASLCLEDPGELLEVLIQLNRRLHHLTRKRTNLAAQSAALCGLWTNLFPHNPK
jgi:trehalose 6-phosphate phosphatase